MIPVILKIGSFIWKYKTYFAAAIIIFAIYSYGYLQGKDHERTKCQAAIQKIYDDLEKDRQAQQEKNDKGSTEFQAGHTERKNKLNDVERKYEKGKSIACAADKHFLQLYTEIAADKAAESAR